MGYASGMARRAEAACAETPVEGRCLLTIYRREVDRAASSEPLDGEALARAVARQRDAVTALLRRRADVVALALGPAAKGTVHPSHSFREREALRVLAAARRNPRRATRAFAERLEREIAKYRSVRDRMMARNLPLVVAIARRHRHPVLSQLDLIQEGTLGLLRAIERYEPDRGTKFATYATWWIWQQLARAADNFGNVIRTPVHWNQFRRKVYRHSAVDNNDLGEEVIDRLASDLGVPSEYGRAMEKGVPCISLDTPSGQGDQSSLADSTAVDTDSDPAALNEAREIRQHIGRVMQLLPPREREVLRLRFGFTPEGPLTLAEVGERYAVSRERVRQIEAQALKRARQLCLAAGIPSI